VKSEVERLHDTYLANASAAAPRAKRVPHRHQVKAGHQEPSRAAAVAGGVGALVVVVAVVAMVVAVVAVLVVFLEASGAEPRVLAA
jgi:Flp pilus assembly protein TadB